MTLQTFVLRGIAAQSAVDAILSLQPHARRVTSEDLRYSQMKSARRAMRVWAHAWRANRGNHEGQAAALFKAVQWRERALALERGAR